MVQERLFLLFRHCVAQERPFLFFNVCVAQKRLFLLLNVWAVLNVSSSLAKTASTLMSSHAMPLKKASDSVTASLSPMKRWVVFLFLRTVPCKMPQFSTLEATSTGEKIVNVDKLWSITTFVQSTSWLIFPSSVETIALQLQPDLFVVFGAVAFATLLVSELTFAKTLFCLYDDPSQTLLCLS